MPVVRRCPKCGDDLNPEEAVCVFCGHPIGRAGAWERLRRRGEDWVLPGALLVVTWLAGLELVLGLVGLAAPGIVSLIRADPALERGLRIALALGVAAIVVGATRRRR